MLGDQVANHMVLAAEAGAAEFAIEARRYADALVAHVTLQVALAQIALVANGAVEALLVLILIRVVAAKDAVLVVILQVCGESNQIESQPAIGWLVSGWSLWCGVVWLIGELESFVVSW